MWWAPDLSHTIMVKIRSNFEKPNIDPVTSIQYLIIKKHDKNFVPLCMNKMYLELKVIFSFFFGRINDSWKVFFWFYYIVDFKLLTVFESKLVLSYEHFLMNKIYFTGPRKMTIVLPKTDENRNRKIFRPISDKTSLLGQFDEGNLDTITGFLLEKQLYWT